MLPLCCPALVPLLLSGFPLGLTPQSKSHLDWGPDNLPVLSHLSFPSHWMDGFNLNGPPPDVVMPLSATAGATLGTDAI